MKPITTSSYTFPTLIEGGYVYVDKTEQLLPLISGEAGQYFLSRPRRFGKSLLISTLEAIFSGRRELFKGLYIDGRDNGKDRYDWKKYPVIHIDMGSMQVKTPEELEETLKEVVRGLARTNGVSFTLQTSSPTLPLLFINLVEQLAAKSPEKKVVILVDEYDKPLFNHLGKNEAIPYRDILKSFYSVIKTTEKFQRFAFITGVSKFTRVSIFSDLNNLTDLTMKANAATLLGYTRAEVEKNFADRLPLLAQEIGKTNEETLDRLARWYDGFRFFAKIPSATTEVAKPGIPTSDVEMPDCGTRDSAQTDSVFNPVSVGKCFDALMFENYWFETATPTFLLELLKKTPLNLQGLTATKDSFSEYDVENPYVLALLVQTGYLTIKKAELENPENEDSATIYHLDFPNHEIKMSFNRWLVQVFSHTGNEEHMILKDLATFLKDGAEIKDTLATLSRYFAKIPYDVSIDQEKYYQALFLAIFVMLNAHVHTEVTTNNGRIDAIIETAKYVYIFEFKLNGTAKAAMQQIHEKKYYERYLNSGKKIMLVGVAFSQKTRNIGRHLVEVVAY